MTTPNVTKAEPSIRKVYAPGDSERDVLKHVYDRYYIIKDFRSGVGTDWDIEGEWDEAEKRWDSWRATKDAGDWKSNIVIPMTTSVIEAMLSEIVEQNLRPFVVERGADDIAKAKVMNAILDYTWEQAKSDIALQDIIKDAFIYGTGIGQEYYWKQPRTIREVAKDGKETKKDVLEYDDCYLEPVRLYDFFVDEKARAFSGPYQARDAIRRYIMDYDDFRTFFTGKNWDTFGNASLVKPGGDLNYYEFYHPPERMQHDREVEVLWYWNKPDDLLAIVANDVLVTSKPNPHKHKQLPFIRVIDVKRPYQFYGKGEPKLLESLQDENDTLRRMIIDRNHLDIDKPILVSDTLTLEDEDIITRPHGIIPVGDINGVKVMEYSDIPASVFKSLDMINDDKVRVTGMDERQQGVSVGGTATEAAILKEQTLKRMNMKMWHIKNDTLIDLGRLRVENIMQFYSQPKLQELVSQDDIDAAKQEGSLVKQDGKQYKATYKNIRLKDQKFQINDQTKQPDITESKGYSFFEAKPEFFLPQHGGFDVRFKATESIPLSKPLMQQRADELYDRLSRSPVVDQWKLAEMELKSRDLNADDFHSQGQPQQPGQGQDQGQQKPPLDVKKMVDLAGVENGEMMQGKKIGMTPYATPVHTEIHVEFMHSDVFKKEATQAIMQQFATHVKGEILALQKRGGQAGPAGLQQEGQPQDQGQGDTGTGSSMASSGGDMNASSGDIMPGKMSGGGDTQNMSGGQSQ